jgi:large repetitive protein
VVQSGTTITVTGVPLESGSFPITLRASNDVGPGFDADFTMYVGNALEIYQVTPTAGIQYHGMLTEILTAGLPTPTISEQGEIPPGLTFTDLRNGVAILSGTPIAAGPYPVTFVVHNGVSPDSSWDADFFINPAPSHVSCSSLTGTAAGQVTVSHCKPATTGYASGSFAATSILGSGSTKTVSTWSPSGKTNTLSWNPIQNIGQGSCPNGSTEIDVTGTIVKGGKATYLKLADAVSLHLCDENGSLSLLTGTKAYL